MSLKLTHPEIYKQLHPTKNIGVDYDKLSKGSSIKVWWLCDKGKLCTHEWEAFVYNRTNPSNPTACPFCCNKKVCLDNCFATVCPEEAKWWHPTKNGELTPYDVAFGAHTVVWFKDECGHENLTRIVHRKDKRGCKKCSERSIGDKTKTTILNKNGSLKDNHPEIYNQIDFNNNLNIDCDKLMSGSDIKINWICAENHRWNAVVYSRTSKSPSGCPSCCHTFSQLEQFTEKAINLSKYNKPHLQNSIINYRPDFKLTETVYLNTDGLYRHNEQNKDRLYHRDMRQSYEAEDKRILQFYEDEIYNKTDIVKSIINIITNNSVVKKIGARKCTIKEVSNIDACIFLTKNHLIGQRSAKHFGLYYNDQLIELMSYEIRKDYAEILRLCSVQNTIVQGGFNKLLKYLINICNKNNIKKIQSLCDLRYADGHGYEKVGFKNIGEYLQYEYTDGKIRSNKRRFRIKAGINEREEAAKKGFYRIYNAGLRKYQLKLT